MSAAKQRRYSVSEIDVMRSAVATMLNHPREHGAIEERLRTYMLNGTAPEELRDAANEYMVKRQRDFEFAQMQSMRDWIPMSTRPA